MQSTIPSLERALGIDQLYRSSVSDEVEFIADNPPAKGTSFETNQTTLHGFVEKCRSNNRSSS